MRYFSEWYGRGNNKTRENNYKYANPNLGFSLSCVLSCGDCANLFTNGCKGKAAYTKAMKGYSLKELWGRVHDQVFLRLKVTLISEPVLKGPKYNGTPFIVTIDGCKYGFAGMLMQNFITVLPNGTEKMTIHPIGFSSK